MRAYCRLFKSSKIIPEKNFAVANIFEYLGSLDYLKFDNIFEGDKTVSISRKPESFQQTKRVTRAGKRFNSMGCEWLK